MTCRFDLQITAQLTTILFQGLLDRAAFSELEAHCRAQMRRGTSVRVLLRAGTKVETDLIEELVRIGGIILEAESPFLSRWIQSYQNNK